MNLARFTRLILSGFRNPQLWNMPEIRDMATPQVLRLKKGKSLVCSKPLVCRTLIFIPVVILAFALPSRALACAACFGQSDSDMAQGLNAGILFLFVIVFGVLGCFAAFAIFLAKRSRAAARAQAEAERAGEGFSWAGSDDEEREFAPLRD